MTLPLERIGHYREKLRTIENEWSKQHKDLTSLGHALQRCGEHLQALRLLLEKKLYRRTSSSAVKPAPEHPKPKKDSVSPPEKPKKLIFDGGKLIEIEDDGKDQPDDTEFFKTR
jgi:hypothetical protein